MSAVVPCPSCEKKLKTPDGAEGKKIRCPNCKTVLLITEDGVELPEEAVGAITSKPGARPAKKRPVEDDEDEDERPARSKKRVAVDDDEDEPDDEDEDRPSRRKKKK